MERKLDLIDRNALYEKAYFHGKMANPCNLYPDGKEAVDVDDIDEMPSIDAVEIVYGKWIPTYTVNWWMNTEKIDGYTCNQCARHFKINSNYCPHCGAYMRGKDNE